MGSSPVQLHRDGIVPQPRLHPVSTVMAIFYAAEEAPAVMKAYAQFITAVIMNTSGCSLVFSAREIAAQRVQIELDEVPVRRYRTA